MHQKQTRILVKATAKIHEQSKKVLFNLFPQMKPRMRNQVNRSCLSKNVTIPFPVCRPEPVRTKSLTVRPGSEEKGPATPWLI